MQAYAEAASKAVAEAENALRLALDAKEPKYDGFEPLLEKLRQTSQDYISIIFPAAVTKHAEDRLWDGHLRVNKKFQKHLKHFREGAGKKRHVERRKAEKSYLHFIKASMHFYRSYIQRLASQSGDVSEISIIANKLHLGATSIDPTVPLSSDQRVALLSSCHNALMRLGDLSRYRETELESKDRNWGPAKGHYQLALSVKPESGAAYNQLAVMALADEDHLRAVYYLHRAAATTKPFPVARDNIKLGFEKLLRLEPEEKPAISDTSKKTLEVLENRFLAFHANCHSRPWDFVTFSKKATEMLQLITLSFEEIKDQTLDKLLQRMCLVSIIAEHLAWTGVSKTSTTDSNVVAAPNAGEHKAQDKYAVERERNSQAVYLLQRFNIMAFTTILKILAREIASENEGSAEDREQESTNVSTAVQKLLPHLRQYSSWLLSNIHSLLNPRHASTGKCLEAFWKVYAKVINVLLSKYSISEIADLEYLLDEDEDTLCFAPFSRNVVKWRYHFDNGPCKPVCKLSPAERQVNAEMLARIRRFVFDAATITNQQEKLKIEWAPIELVGGEFVFREKPVTTIPIIETPKTPSQPFRSRAHAHASSLNGISPMPSPKPEKEPAEPKFTQAGQETPRSKFVQGQSVAAMETMVNNLVNYQSKESSPPSDGTTQVPVQGFNSSSVVTGTPNLAASPLNIMDIVKGMQQKPSQPSQPDIMDIVRTMQHRDAETLPTPSASTQTHHARVSNASIPGIWNTAFTPRPGENTGSLSQPSTASVSPAPFQLPLSSSVFHQNLAQQERDIQMRTSPYQAPFLSSWSETPKTPVLQQPQMWKSGPASPWQSPPVQSPSQPTTDLRPAALFGAIGEQRKIVSRPIPDRPLD